MLRKIDSKPIFFKYIIGHDAENDNRPIYSNTHITYGHISKSGTANDNYYGMDLDYDILLLLNYTQETKLIDEQTAFYIEDMPTDLLPNGDYKVLRISPVKLNEFSVYLKKIDGVEHYNLYYLGDVNNVPTIISFRANFDKTSLTAYIPKNNYIPFTDKTKIWLKRPKSIDDNANCIQLIENKLIYNSNYRLVFKKV